MVKTTISLSSYVLLSVEVLVPYPERLFLVLVFVPSEIVLDLIVSELTFFEGHYSLLYAGKLLVFCYMDYESFDMYDRIRCFRERS